MRTQQRLLRRFVLTAALVAGGIAAAPPASAADNPYERGPAPTVQSIEASRGSFAVTDAAISGQSGFGGGRIYYPSDATQTYGAVAIVPGYLSIWAEMAWLGPRLASNGFVVIGVETSGLLDQPSSRSDQLKAALNWATTTSPAASRIDKSRLAVAGWSMGGGGTLETALEMPSLKAAIPLAPVHFTQTNYSDLRVPTMVIDGETDLIAPPDNYGGKYYGTFPSSIEKAHLIINDQGHFFTIWENPTQGKYMLSWLKRFVDNDTRYSQFLCPGPSTGETIQAYTASCPI